MYIAFTADEHNLIANTASNSVMLTIQVAKIWQKKQTEYNKKLYRQVSGNDKMSDMSQLASNLKCWYDVVNLNEDDTTLILEQFEEATLLVPDDFDPADESTYPSFGLDV